jgi:hypothetical protein
MSVKPCQASKQQITASIQHIRVAYQLCSNRYNGSKEAKGPRENRGPSRLKKYSFICNILQVNHLESIFLQTLPISKSMILNDLRAEYPQGGRGVPANGKEDRCPPQPTTENRSLVTPQRPAHPQTRPRLPPRLRSWPLVRSSVISAHSASSSPQSREAPAPPRPHRPPRPAPAPSGPA